MIFRWKFVGLRAAENALAEGRVDEAYQRLCDPALRSEERARRLIQELGRLLAARARLAAQSGDYTAVVADAERLERLGQADADVRLLRAQAEAALGERGVREALERAALRKAVEAVEAGRLESGRLAVQNVADSAQRARLENQLDARLRRSEEWLDRASAALQSGDVFGALRAWREACGRFGQTRRSDALAADIARALEAAISEAYATGRLDRVRDTFEAGAALREHWGAYREYERLVALLRLSARFLAAGDCSRLREVLLRLRAAGGATPWLEAALRDVVTWSDSQASLLASPLGLLGGAVYTGSEIVTAGGAGAGHNRDQGEKAPNAAVDERPRWNRPLLVLVDGSGSFLLVRGDVVRIGRAHGSGGVDVPIPAEVQSHHADIVRQGEDYMLVAHGPARLNQHTVMRALLRDGDRIALGGSAKFVFRRPSARSESAVLQLPSHCRLPLDVSAVVLFRGTCIIGPQAASHLRTREGESGLVIFEREGVLMTRATTSDGQPSGPAQPLELGRTRDFGDLRITVKDYAPAGGGLA